MKYLFLVLFLIPIFGYASSERDNYKSLNYSIVKLTTPLPPLKDKNELELSMYLSTWKVQTWNLDFEKPTVIYSSQNGSKTITAPELFYKPCKSSFWDGLEDCQLSEARYSEASGGIYISGYERGVDDTSKIKSYFVNGAVVKSLPVEDGKKTSYRGEASNLSSAILQTPQGDLMIHNAHGQEILKIPLSQNKTEVPFSWMIRSFPERKKTYVVNSGLKGSTPFVYELIEGPALKQISVPKEAEGWLSLYIIPGTNDLWIISLRGVYIMSGDTFHQVVKIDPPYNLHGPAHIQVSKKDGIYFTIDKESSGEMFPYSIKPVASEGNLKLGDIINLKPE